MTRFNALKALSVGATICIGALAAAACTIHLRGDENPPETAASVAQSTDPSADLERCRTIDYEQQDKLRECRKIWAEKRRQFLGRDSDGARDPARPDPEAMPPASLKDQNRLPSDLFPTPMNSER